jgi:uncharacterized protein
VKAMKKLDKRINLYHLVVRTIGSMIVYGAFIFVLVTPKDFFDYDIIKTVILIMLGIVVAILLVFNFILFNFVYRLHGYELNEDYFMIQKGVLFRRQDFIPIKRIQHIEKFQGPIQTLFKIHTLIVYTAGSNDQIAGIPSSEVETLIHDIRTKLQSYLDSDEATTDES